MTPHRTLLALALAALPLAAAAPTHPITAVDPAYMNRSVSPCKDFYEYANGAFDKVPIPGEYASYGVNEEIDARNEAILKHILETAAATRAPKGTLAQRVGDFYASGMDEALIEKAGIQPLAPVFKAIAEVKTPAELMAEIARLDRLGLGAGAGFGFGVQVDDRDSSAMIAGFYQGGLGLPERGYYLRPGKEAETLRQAYVAHIGRMFELAGDAPAAAKAEADSVMALETKLAKDSRTIVQLRDPQTNYHKVALGELPTLAPGFHWHTFVTAVGLPASETHVLVGQPEFFKALGGLMASEPMAIWRTYLRWRVLSEAAPYLGHAFVDESFAFYGKTLSGTTALRPRWKRVLGAEDRALGFDLGQLYVKAAFSPEAKAEVLEMVKYHKEALRARILAADWMDSATKQQALRKLEAMRAKVGYPDRWRDYSGLAISRQPYILNVEAAAAFSFQRRMAKLGKPVDRDEWNMTPQTNNAYYDPSMNEIVLPAGILQPPFFSVKADDASNYGALASTIGHEMTHGFDDQGRQYDWQGNLKDWWTPEDARRFKARAERIVKQYDAYEPLPGLHINGEQTLGENIADVGGLRISYDAFKLATRGKHLKSIGGFTPDQRFFIAFAQGWRTNQRPEAVRMQVRTDVHSPVRFRVIGPVSDLPAFGRAFGCKPADPSAAIW